MKSILDEKIHLRAHFRRVLEAIPLDELATLSRRVHAHVVSIPELQSIRVILTYVALPHEVQTMPLIERWLAEGKQVFVPYLADRASPMAWCVLSDTGHLVRGPFGVLQPEDSVPQAPPPEAPVLVPGLAFTRTGQRLGRGGGHFDRFLAGHHRVSVGLALAPILASQLPVVAHDVRVDIVVTESEVFRYFPTIGTGKK